MMQAVKRLKNLVGPNQKKILFFIYKGLAPALLLFYKTQRYLRYS